MIRKILLPLGAKLKELAGRPKKLLAGVATLVLAGGLLVPSPAQAWWGPGWGWHSGWGWHAGWAWRPGIVIGVPPVAVAAPAYPVPACRWVPAHYTWNGYYIPGHWRY